MDHACLNPKCDEIWFDNAQDTPCPAGCEGYGCTNHFDEFPEWEPDGQDDYDFDGEDW
jgi:hypothetical protein